MADRITLHSVSEGQIVDLGQGIRSNLNPSATFSVSHRIATAVEIEPARSLLGEALDGGQDLMEAGSLPTAVHRARFHGRIETRKLEGVLRSAWNAMETDAAFHLHRSRGWWEDEVGVVLRALDHAASRDECLVSILIRSVDRDSKAMFRLFAAR